jgi:phage terminase Nu1 subunit (DNA packaging protein)
LHHIAKKETKLSAKVGGAAAVGKRLHVSRRTVFNLEKIGLPKLGPGRYDLDACEKWYSDYSAKEGLPPEVAVQRARWLAAKASREELMLAKERGELVPVAVPTKAWGAMIQASRSKLLALPNRLAPQIVSCNSIAEVSEALRAAIYECLDELAEPETARRISKTAFPDEPITPSRGRDRRRTR